MAFFRSGIASDGIETAATALDPFALGSVLPFLADDASPGLGLGAGVGSLASGLGIHGAMRAYASALQMFTSDIVSLKNTFSMDSFYFADLFLFHVAE